MAEFDIYSSTITTIIPMSMALTATRLSLVAACVAPLALGRSSTLHSSAPKCSRVGLNKCKLKHCFFSFTEYRSKNTHLFQWEGVEHPKPPLATPLHLVVFLLFCHCLSVRLLLCEFGFKPTFSFLSVCMTVLTPGEIKV